MFEWAAWDRSNVTIWVQGEGPGSVVSIAEVGVPQTGPPTLAIDDLVQQQDLPAVNFIKMKVEGAELPSLRGTTQTIQHHKPRLAISVYHRLTDFFEIPEFLAALVCGYRYFLRH